MGRFRQIRQCDLNTIALNVEHFCHFSLNIDILCLEEAKIAALRIRKRKP
jgi:hypothetical protein